MAVFYTLYQNNREGFASKGKWYARVRVNKATTTEGATPDSALNNNAPRTE